MSRRKRIARVTVVTLLILGMGSIGTAGAFATQAIDPTPVPTRAGSAQGILGLGGGASSPLSQPVKAADKIAFLTKPAAAALVVPAAKAATPAPKPAKRVVAAKKKRTTPRAKSVSRLGRGWRSARVSWYGPGFYGHTMAGGGKLRRDSMVVAHRSLPFGTKIEFSYKGRTCIATVRDRGPFVRGRVFDLGPGAAKALGFGGVGVVKYRIL